MKTQRHRLWLAGTLAVAVGAVGVVTATSAQAATGCRVDYVVTNQWSGGFGANVTVTNLGDAINGWRLTWSFTAGQTITQLWNGSVTQSGAQVTVVNASYNGALGTGANTAFGFNGAWNGSNPTPPSFALGGTTCTGRVGATTPPPSTPPPVTTPPVTTPPPSGSLPSSFRWSDRGQILAPKSDASHNIVSIKDPTIVRYNNEWLVYATTANTAGQWSLVYTHFGDFSQANAAPQYYLNNNPNIGNGYRAAPQLFYFAPKNKWFMVYQQGPPAYSTADDPTRPETWTAPQNFISTEPAVVTQNKGSGGWIDFWVICDSANCYLFFSDDNGTLYRAQTTVANFPAGFGNTVVVMKDTSNRFNLFEASNVYKVQGTNQYLLIVEAIGSTGRYFRSWTSTSLSGSWTPLADSQTNPFARSSNVTFSGSPWTNDISHGEMIRAGNNQLLEISPCHMQYLYQGMAPGSSGDYSQLPWRLGLLTQTNSTC
jgi:endo-1,4-beta-xylanase